jgi:tRNA(adenine34) deaminase
MCAWAIINARFKNVYFGSYDTKYGAFGGAINLAKLANSKINIKGGILEEQCNKLLKDYFEKLKNSPVYIIFYLKTVIVLSLFINLLS